MIFIGVGFLLFIGAAVGIIHLVYIVSGARDMCKFFETEAEKARLMEKKEIR